MKKIVFLISLFCCILIKAQQDPQYSMYMFNHLAINPAYAGSKDALSTTFLVRKQWSGVDGAPKTSVISLHAPIKKKFIGLGGYIYNDVIGPKKITGAYGTYSYRLRLGNGNLALGIGTGIVSYNFNWSMIKFKDQGDVSTYFENSNKTVFDFTGGLYYQDKSFYTGLSMTHINRASLFTHTPVDTNDFYINTRLNFHAFYTIGKGFKLGENYILNPSMVIKYYGNSLPSVDVNVNFNMKQKIWVGLSYRSNYGMVLLTQFNINEKLKIGYSLDRGFNRLGKIAGFSHEIMFGYDFNLYHSKIVSPRFL
jgi:type IX secretion system PorP/SprF family membrane protein